MTSSVLDGAGCESPAPPAFSPLTDPADPGNREPSVGVPINAEATLDDASRSHSQQNDDTTTTVNGNDSHLPSATDLTQHPRHDHHSHSRPQTARDPAAPATPATPARPHLNTTMMNNTMDLDMPMNSGMDYTASPALDLYSPYAAQQSSQLLMALARISAAQSQSQMIVHPPSTVRPSQVSLPPHSILDASNNLVLATPHASNAVPHVDAPLESFARIEFADSVFQMTTYAVVIGRDQRALDQARRDERRHDDYERKKRDHEERGLPAPLPPIQDRGKFSKSYVSEEGGMLGPESDGDDNPRPAKRRKTSGGVGSASGDSQRVEPAAGELASLEDKNPINRQYVSHTPGAAAVNLSALRPSPHYVPFIGIHSPGPNIASRTKAISREHLKIKFNKADGVFEAIPLHKNGFFCEDVHYKEDKVVLKSGDHLQIKDVDFVFVINGVPHGKTGAEDGLMEEDGVSSRRYSEGGKEMSFDFESTYDPARRSTSPEEIPAVEAPREDSDSELSEPAEDDPEPELEEAAELEVMETIEKDTDLSATVKPEMPLELLASLEPIVPKKRGPGRPPKNGIMSKREERLRKKAAMEIAKKNMPQPPPGEPPIKRKVGRPRKHPLPENAPDRPEKRKYKPRKSKTGEEGEEGSDPEKTIKERRREKPKTPPLELDRNDYTEEQLQKPPKNYGMLIDEVLTAAPDGLTLKQIYKRIQMKYPFYYFTVDTKGWESSVRHNLIGNDAFKKNEETHLWSRVPGIDIDAGKKRTKATSPDHSTSMHTFGQHYSTSATPTPQMFHAETGLQQGYRAAPAPQRPGYAPGQAARGQHPQSQLGAQAVGGATQQAPRQPYSVPGQVQGATPAAAYGNQTGGHPPQGSAQATAYSSPYASRPPPAATAQPGGPTQGIARQGLPPNHLATAANGLPRAGPPSAQAAPPAGPQPAQPALNGSPLPFKPAVAPELVRHVTNFRATVTEQLKQRTSASEAIALSVIHRGLGLMSESMVPDQADLERIVSGVFESSRKNLGANQSLHPGLVQALGKFKIDMIKTLEPKMGKLNAERLILSAVDRVLGFNDRSTMPTTDSDRKQLLEAENVLIGAIQRVVTTHQRTLASAASAVPPPPAPTPGPSSAASTTPSSAQMPTQGHAPAPSHAPAGAYSSTTAPLHQGARPATSLPTAAAPGPARPPAPAQSTPTTQPATVASTQQVPCPATVSAPAPQTPAAPTAQTRPQVPVSGPAQGPVQTPGQYSAPTTAVSARNPALTGAAQTSVASATQPQSPAHALAQARAQAAAQNAQAQKPAQVPGPASSLATATNQIAGQAPPAASAYPSVPKGPALASAPTVSQPQNQQALPPKPQGQAPGAASAPQRLGHSAPAPHMAPPAVTPAQTTTTAAAPAPAQAQLPTAPAVPAQRPAQAAPVAAAPATVSQGSSSLPAPIQRPVQPVAANSPLPATAQNRVASASPGTSHTMSQSPTPPVASNPPVPAQPSSQGAQAATPVPSASPPLPAQPPAPPAPMANMTAATTPTAPASAPPPTPAATTVTAAR